MNDSTTRHRLCMFDADLILCKTRAALEDAISEDAIITKRANDIFKTIWDVSERGAGELSLVFNIDPENETEEYFARSINLIHRLLITRGYKVTVKGVVGHSYSVNIDWEGNDNADIT